MKKKYRVDQLGVECTASNVAQRANQVCISIVYVTIGLVSTGCMQDGGGFAGTRNYMRDIELQPGSDDGLVNAVIEIPAGTREKWEVDPQTGFMGQDVEDGKPRVIRYSMPYPANYGMIPRTVQSLEKGGDGDPLDVIVLGPVTKRGETVAVRPIGVMRMTDSGETDDKIISVHPADPFVGSIESLDSLEHDFPGTLSILDTWFTQYKCKPGKIAVTGFDGPGQAQEAILEAYHSFTNNDESRSSPLPPLDLTKEVSSRSSESLTLFCPSRMVGGKALSLVAELRNRSGLTDWRIWHQIGEIKAACAKDGRPVRIQSSVFESFPAGAGGESLPQNSMRFYNSVGSVSLFLDSEGIELPADIQITVRVGLLQASQTIRVLDGSRPEGLRALSGTLSDGDLVWSPERGVVHLTGSVTVPESRVLKIAPGTLIMADPGPAGEGTAILVKGAIEAIGTRYEPIFFFAAAGEAAMKLPQEHLNNDNAWRGIWHEGDATSRYSNVIISGAGNGAIEFHPRPPIMRFEGTCSALFEDSAILDCPGKAFHTNGSGDYRILRSLVSRVGIGGEFFGENHHLLIEDTWFSRIGRAPEASGADGDMIHLNTASAIQIIRRCILTDGGDDAIDHSDSHPIVEDCIIYDIRDKSASLTGGSLTVRNTLVFNAGSGFRGAVSAEKCTITVASPISCPVNVSQCIITPFTICGSSGVIRNCLLGLPCGIESGDTNRSADPLFVSPRSNDFSVGPDSPAIGMGPQGETIGWQGFETRRK